MSSEPTITLPGQLKERLQQGHPWVYRTHIPAGAMFTSGTWVRARCVNWSAYGLWDAEGAIALRIFRPDTPPDARWLRDRIADAWDLRAPLRDAGCTAYRLLFGEGDGVPGITIDLYGEYAVVQTYLPGAEQLVSWLTNALLATVRPRGILIRRRHEDAPEEQRTPDGKVALLWGEWPPASLIVNEHGLLFEADLREGQKTGLFLDHRENRHALEGWSNGLNVLNCFAYTGAFSLYALRGGAAHVTSVDIGQGLSASAAANIAHNGLNERQHTFITEDCFAVLERFVAQRRTFDLVILDPPSFARSRQSRFAAIRAYTRLNALALRCVAPNGLLASASCTSQVGPEPFKDMLAAAGAQANRRLQIIHEAGQPLDHPVPPQFPEGRYLKFVLCRAR